MRRPHTACHVETNCTKPANSQMRLDSNMRRIAAILLIYNTRPYAKAHYGQQYRHDMPLVKVSMYPGRSTQQKSELAAAITRAAAEILKIKENHVIVVYDDNPQENWYQAGRPL